MRSRLLVYKHSCLAGNLDFDSCDWLFVGPWRGGYDSVIRDVLFPLCRKWLKHPFLDGYMEAAACGVVVAAVRAVDSIEAGALDEWLRVLQVRVELIHATAAASREVTRLRIELARGDGRVVEAGETP